MRSNFQPIALLAAGAMPRNDADLVARIKKSDPAALGELYDRYGKLAYTVILRIVGEQPVAEDLLAETFVILWNQMERWEDDRREDLRLWLLLSARAHAIEYLRHRNEPLPRSLPALSAFLQPSVLQDFPRPQDPKEWQRLRELVATLSEHEQEILEMAAFDGLPAGEIAIRLAEKAAVVKESIGSAIGKLSGSP